jgi:outer membrane immunogenic protein
MSRARRKSRWQAVEAEFVFGFVSSLWLNDHELLVWRGFLMKRHLSWAIASVISIGAIGGALAADMPLKAPPPLPPACVWCGFYIGGDVGGYWTNQSVTTTGFPAPGFGAPAIVGAGIPGFGILPTAHDLNSSGALGGFHFGYNWQFANWLVGLEGDWMALSHKVTSTATTFDTFGGPRADGTMLLASNNEWLASARVRLGWVAGPWMLYGTGGAAFTRTARATFTPIPGTFGPVASTSTVNLDGANTGAGFVVGAGAEWMIAPHWTVRAEYLFYGFPGGTVQLPLVVAPGNGCNPAACGWNVSTSRLDINTVRVGFSYGF